MGTIFRDVFCRRVPLPSPPRSLLNYSPQESVFQIPSPHLYDRIELSGSPSHFPTPPPETLADYLSGELRFALSS